MVKGSPLWHIFPVELYRKHESSLLADLSAGQQSKIHVLTFDYQGFGRSTGTRSESGLLLPSLAVLDWIMNLAEFLLPSFIWSINGHRR